MRSAANNVANVELPRSAERDDGQVASAWSGNQPAVRRSRPDGHGSGTLRGRARRAGEARADVARRAGRPGRASGDLFLAQRFARHVSPLTTTVYTHPSDEEMYQRVRGLSC